MLVLHGEEDEIAPISQGQDMYDAATKSSSRCIKRFPNAGHNNLLQVHRSEYFAQLKRIIERALRPDGTNSSAETSSATTSTAPASSMEAVVVEAQALLADGNYVEVSVGREFLY